MESLLTAFERHLQLMLFRSAWTLKHSSTTGRFREHVYLASRRQSYFCLEPTHKRHLCWRQLNDDAHLVRATAPIS